MKKKKKLKLPTQSLTSVSDLHTSHLLKFVNLPDEEIPIAPGDFGVCDVNHVLWERESQKSSEVEPRLDL